MKTFLIIGSILLIAALVPTIYADEGVEGDGDETTMTRKRMKKMQRKKHNNGGSKSSKKGSDPTEVNMCYFADPTYTQGTALVDLLGSDVTYTHANAVNEQYSNLVTRWDMDEITAEFVYGEGEDIGLVHAGLEVTGELICAFTVLLVTQMKNTCNYGKELEGKYGTVAIVYMNGFAQGAGLDPDFKIQENCVDAFTDAGFVGAFLIPWG